MFRMSPFAIRSTAAPAGLLLLGLVSTVASLALAQNPPVQIPSRACRTPAEEAELNRRERDQIGPRHAAEHSRMRAVQCQVERGIRAVPAQGIVKPAEETLKTDEAVKQAAIQVANQRKVKPPNPPPPPPEATLGRWSDPFVIPVVGVTAVLLHTGNVMFWSYDPATYHNPQISNLAVGYIWNPTSRTGYQLPPLPDNIWCGGQTILSDGRVFIAGGNLRYPDWNAPSNQNYKGLLKTFTFNPLTEKFTAQPDMMNGRWYPTVTKLADNRVVVTSGYDETGNWNLNTSVELFTPNPNNIDGEKGTLKAISTQWSSGLYPPQFVLPSGRMLQAGPSAGTSTTLINSNTTTDPALDNWRWEWHAALSSDHYNYPNGMSYSNASVTPARQVVMIAGGTAQDQSVAANEWMDGNSPQSGWKPYPKWTQPRHNSNTVGLPDGSMLVVGGNSGMDLYDNPVFKTELYSKAADDLTGVWQTVAPHVIQGAYHSSAILLPDATVLLSQDDMQSTPTAAAQHKAQVYSPPYLFKGAQPRILSVNGNTAGTLDLQRGQSFTVSADRSTIASAVLIAPGATTHGNDMHQRVIKLSTQTITNGLTGTIPTFGALVPPGYYMLFIVDSAGIPSVAKFVRVT